MNTIWWDEESGQVCISSLSQTFPPRTLVAKTSNGTVFVHRRMNGDTLIAAAPGQIARRSGETFTDPVACVAYLNGVFDRRLPQGDLYSVNIAIAERGQTLIPLDTPPGNYASLRLVVNGVEYRAPDIAVSPVAVTWPADAFPLDPLDRVTVVYS